MGPIPKVLKSPEDSSVKVKDLVLACTLDRKGGKNHLHYLCSRRTWAGSSHLKWSGWTSTLLNIYGWLYMMGGQITEGHRRWSTCSPALLPLPFTLVTTRHSQQLHVGPYASRGMVVQGFEIIKMGRSHNRGLLWWPRGLRLHLPMQGATGIPSGDLRSHMPLGQKTNTWNRSITQLNEHEFEQTPGDSRRGSPACCSLRGCKKGHDLGTEQQQQNRSNIVANLITLKTVHIKIFFKKSQQKTRKVNIFKLAVPTIILSTIANKWLWKPCNTHKLSWELKKKNLQLPGWHVFCLFTDKWPSLKLGWCIQAGINIWSSNWGTSLFSSV